MGSWIVATEREGHEYALCAAYAGGEPTRLYLSKEHAERIAGVLTANFGDPWTAKETGHEPT